MYDPTNIFSKILKQEIPCKKVFEDDHVLAFHDIHPKARTHVLVIPKGPFISYSHFMEEASDEMISDFFRGVTKTANILNLKGYRLSTNNGPEAGQEVPHFHVHILSD